MTIRCPKCQTENPPDSKFCKECATPISRPDLRQPSVTKTLETPQEPMARGSLFAGRYEIIEALGAGGMGEVYRVEDKKVGQEVALKLIRPEIAANTRAVERFRHELKTARMIAHRNVCRMFDLGEDKGTYFITMEYVPGEDLRGFIRRAKHLSLATAVDFAGQVAEGLAEAHRLGVVHRDLKPGNVMIDRDGNARIMDFGIARLLSAKGITGAGVAVGTPDYMSPEQVEGKEVDGRADIYSLGIMLYEMVAGRVPFEADTAMALGYKHKHEAPASPQALNPQVPDDLSGLILRCLEKEPVKRFQTADELRAELEKIEKSLPTTTASTRAPITRRTPLTSREITIKFTAKKLLVPGLPIMAGVAAVILAVVLLPHRPPPPKAAPGHKQITFTGSADYPAISPDGKFLAYTDDISMIERKVMIQDLAGGQAVEVFRGRNCGYLRWSPDGTELAFNSQRSDWIWATFIVPRLGGKPRELEEVEEGVWSPDGSQFAHWSESDRRLVFTNRTTGESKAVALDESFPPYIDDLDWSLSGELIALSMRDDKNVYSVWTVAADGSRQSKLVEDPKNYLGSPRFSPRGDAVYYLHDSDETTNIRKIPVAPDTGRPAGPASPILDGIEIGSYFTITADGKSLAYPRETWYFNLWLASFGGPGQNRTVDIRPLTTGTLTTFCPSLSPDGKLVAYASGRVTTEIYVMPVEGGTPQQITFLKAWSTSPAWSPDGKEIAFYSNQGGLDRIWKVDTAGGTPRPLAAFDGAWTTAILAWAPGPKILYVAHKGLGITAVDPKTGEVRQLFKGDADYGFQMPTWSSDGKRISVWWNRDAEGDYGLWTFSADGSPGSMLRKGAVAPIGWSSDGKWIYGWEWVAGEGKVLTISAENGREEVLFTLPLGPETGKIYLYPRTVDGKRFVFSAKKSQSDVWVVENFDPEIK